MRRKPMPFNQRNGKYKHEEAGKNQEPYRARFCHGLS